MQTPSKVGGGPTFIQGIAMVHNDEPIGAADLKSYSKVGKEAQNVSQRQDILRQLDRSDLSGPVVNHGSRPSLSGRISAQKQQNEEPPRSVGQRYSRADRQG